MASFWDIVKKGAKGFVDYGNPYGWGYAAATGGGSLTEGIGDAFQGAGDALSGKVKYQPEGYQIGGTGAEQLRYGQQYSPEEARAMSREDPAGFGAAVGRGELIINEDGSVSRPADARQIHAGRMAESRGAIGGVLGDAEAAYRGEGPSLAADILEQGTERAAGEQYSMAASAPVTGGSQAALFAEAGRNAAVAGQQASREAAMQRAAEQQQAMDTRASLAPTLGEQDIMRAQMDQDAELRRQEMKTGIKKQEAAGKQKLIGDTMAAVGTMAASSDIRAKDNIQPIDMGYDPQRMMVERQERMQDSGLNLDMMSDEDSKEYIARLEDALGESRAELAGVRGASYPEPEAPPEMELATAEGSREGLAPVQPYRYQYKPEFAAAQGTDTEERTGVMAQELEQSPYYEDVVQDTPAGKVIDGQRALSANLAASAGLDKRLRRLEEASGAQLIGLDERMPQTAMPTPRSPRY